MKRIANFLNARISGFVTDKPEILAAYSRDASILEIRPRLLCIPQTIEDIQYIVRFTNELAKKGYQLPISVRGAGLDQSGADLSEGVVISTERLNKIQEIDDRERLVRVQAGVTLGQLNSALSLFGLRLPIEADPRETIGGLVSNFYTDKIAKKYGSIYYYVDRIEAILSSGELFQSQSLTPRGLKIAKTRSGLPGKIYQELDRIIREKHGAISDLRSNAHFHAGYRMVTEVNPKKQSFDLSPLFFGAQGSIGVITELILRTVPLSRPTKKALFAFKNLKLTIDFMSELQKLQPLRIDFYDSRIFQSINFEKSDLGFLQDREGKFLVSTEFDDHFLKNLQNLKKISKLPHTFTRSLVDQPSILEQFNQLTKILEYYRNDSETPERIVIVDRSFIPAAELESFIESLTTLERFFNQPLPLFGSFSTGLYSIRPAFNLSNLSDRKQLLRLMQQYGKLIHDSGGSVAGGSAEGLVQAIIFNQNLSVQNRILFHEIKTLFDPNNIFNPKIKQSATLADVARFMRTSPQIGLICQD